MPLIAPQQKQQREPLTVRLDVRVLVVLGRYADFIASGLNYVVGQALLLTFGKDQDLRQWLHHGIRRASAGSARSRLARRVLSRLLAS